MNEMNFDCKVCEKCSQAMTAAAYHSHVCADDVDRLRAMADHEDATTKDVVGPMAISPALLALKDKGGRPKGYPGTRSKMPSAMAQAFKRAGLDWQADFAAAIKRASNYDLSKAERNEARDRIALWLRLLPYLITSSARSKGKKWKGGPSKAALIALEQLEDRGD